MTEYRNCPFCGSPRITTILTTRTLVRYSCGKCRRPWTATDGDVEPPGSRSSTVVLAGVARGAPIYPTDDHEPGNRPAGVKQ